MPTMCQAHTSGNKTKLWLSRNILAGETDTKGKRWYESMSDCIKCAVENKNAGAELFNLGWPRERGH